MEINQFAHKLIVFEGIDGTGKTSAAYGVVKELDHRAERLDLPVFDDSTIEQICNLIGQEIANQKVFETLVGKRFGGAVQIDDLPFHNPINALDKKAFEDRYGIDLGVHLYLLSCIFKDRAIRALLPHLHVVCDRYIYSLMARHKAFGTNPRLIRYEELDIIKPDLFYQLRTQEFERMRRVQTRGNPHRFDLIPNSPGTRHWLIEKEIEQYTPQIIDNTEMTCEEVISAVMADFELFCINKQTVKKT